MKIALIGYGKMGREIEKFALANHDEVVLRISSKNLSEINNLKRFAPDVCIEFSRPESAFENIKLCLENEIPVVSGTTAWLDKLDEAKQIAADNNTALFYAPNFSLGVNLFFAINTYAAKLMGKFSNYNTSIEEIHHKEKLDAPSGTAIRLAENVIPELPNKSDWELNQAHKNTDLIITSKREDGVPGTHTTFFDSVEDQINITHTANSRAGFAKGAYQAAKWIIGKKGYFEMKDMLGI